MNSGTFAARTVCYAVCVFALAIPARAQAAVEDVAAWLKRHGVAAVPVATRAIGMEIDNFTAELAERKCGLLVAGAYGHSRLREWGFGGVTMDLLVSPDRCALLSH